jgi:hypothetical protein
VRKEILWESEIATNADVRATERHFIRETGANNPAVGYNLTPKLVGVAVGLPCVTAKLPDPYRRKSAVPAGCGTVSGRRSGRRVGRGDEQRPSG